MASNKGKPDWKDAPEWANWLAQDQNGAWFWYEHTPRLGGRMWVNVEGYCVRAGLAEPFVSSWDETKEARPEASARSLSDPAQAHCELRDGLIALTRQEGGGHYKDMAIQPVQFIHANKIGFLEGNVIKYVSRWRAKGGIEDLRKARHYLDLLIELEGPDHG